MTTATTSTGDVTIGARPTPSLYRVEVNPRNLTARRNLADPAQMHRRLMSLLPDDLGDTPRAAARLLYRLEKSREPVLLVQSGMPLDFDRLPAGWAHQIRQASLAGLLHTLQDGMQLQIRTRVSAVKSAGKSSLRAGQRVSVHQPELREWWRHRADAAGLRMNDDLGWEASRENMICSSTGAAWAPAIVEGIAAVTSAEALSTAIIDGVGKARAYGFGLLSARPMA